MSAELVQGSEEWLAWRRRGLGGSDAPVVMNMSPWMTRYQLWEDKLGKAPPKATNWAMQRGIEEEPKARAFYEMEVGEDFSPATLVHPTIPFMLASLDGLNRELGRILEIKRPGKEDHAKALAGEVPAKYLHQLHHCMIVAGVDEADYLSYHPETPKIIRVKADKSVHKQLIDEEAKFWELVQKQIAPEFDDRDYRILKDRGAVKLFTAFRKEKAKLDAIEARVEELRKSIVDQYQEPRISCAGVTLLRNERKGNVDYKKIPELKGVDLEQYRGKPTTVVTIKVKA